MNKEQKIKFYYRYGNPTFQLGEFYYIIVESYSDSYWDNSMKYYSPRFILIRRVIDNEEKEFYIESREKLEKFIDTMCPNGKLVLTHNESNLYTNYVTEVVVTQEQVVKGRFPNKDEMAKITKRNRWIYDDVYFEYVDRYSIKVRKAIQIIKEKLGDKKAALEYTREYLERLIESEQKSLQPDLPLWD